MQNLMRLKEKQKKTTIKIQVRWKKTNKAIRVQDTLGQTLTRKCNCDVSTK